ncbi:MAG: AAA family ATPase, partial [Caldilineaceae bacterium]|nr:AAA family ATPase [Caldilineaceae bacterium]
RTVDFRNTVIIMTSNLGSQYILDAVERQRHEDDNVATVDEEVEKRVRQVLREHFRPEFLNRLDEIVVFHALHKEQLKAIIEIQLGHLRKLLKERNITLELTEKAKELLVQEGYDPAFGARPLKRVLQHRIADPLAVQILEGKIFNGEHLLVDAIGDELTFTAIEALAG